MRWLACALLAVLAAILALALGDLSSPGKWAWFVLGEAFGIGPCMDAIRWIARKKRTS